METRYTILRRVYSGALLVIWIIAPYALLQQVTIREVIWVQPTAFDQAIAVNFYSVWVYLSLYPLLGWTGLGVERPVYLRYLLTIGWVTLVSHMVFLFFPSGVSRDILEGMDTPVVYEWLAFLDRPRNAFPSLHASLSIIAGIAISASTRYPVVVKVLTWLWVLAIFWSTIALRQHYAWDLISGTILAVVVWGIVGCWKGRQNFCGGF
ncbi:hypothetical protein Rhal01_01129 [Rubritalea halochordaticola]|uniref:Inositolphosphotransferase Aur1/Ipt1 domain-containing protein n=1 Tax=Rubritalea halochordaticola TaxID=714537 RepID=A0ABP9V1K0_9BACT